MATLDEWLPEYDASEFHERQVSGSPEAIFERAVRTAAAPDPVVGLLFRLRGLPRATTIAELFETMRFEELERTPTSVVFGATGRPWRPARAAIGPFADARPETVRVAFILATEPGRLWTETRIAALDAPARRAFSRYWRIVGPFSALIRRRWLETAAR